VRAPFIVQQTAGTSVQDRLLKASLYCKPQRMQSQHSRLMQLRKTSALRTSTYCLPHSGRLSVICCSYADRQQPNTCIKRRETGNLFVTAQVPCIACSSGRGSSSPQPKLPNMHHSMGRNTNVSPSAALHATQAPTSFHCICFTLESQHYA
jgi:hypothetical protein